MREEGFPSAARAKRMLDGAGLCNAVISAPVISMKI